MSVGGLGLGYGEEAEGDCAHDFEGMEGLHGDGRGARAGKRADVTRCSDAGFSAEIIFPFRQFLRSLNTFHLSQQ